MASIALNEDEFRLLAYIRAYSDNRQQHLDPSWVQKQLNFSLEQMQHASRGLAKFGLAEFLEWEPPAEIINTHPQLQAGPNPMDICLTERGWDYLRKDKLE